MMWSPTVTRKGEDQETLKKIRNNFATYRRQRETFVGLSQLGLALRDAEDLSVDAGEDERTVAANLVETHRNDLTMWVEELLTAQKAGRPDPLALEYCFDAMELFAESAEFFVLDPYFDRVFRAVGDVIGEISAEESEISIRACRQRLRELPDEEGIRLVSALRTLGLTIRL
jgi:hypothetical protein